MANPWGIPVTGWILGWLLSPLFNLLWNKLFAYLSADTLRKLRELKHSIPGLKRMLTNVEEQRIANEAKDNRPESDPMVLEEIAKDLQSALYEAEDILDLVDYYRIERKVLGDCSWVQHLLSAAGSCITLCKESWFGKCVEIIGAALLQCAKGVGAALRKSSERLPIFQRPSVSNHTVQRICAWSDFLDIKAHCRSMQSWIDKTYTAACFCRNCSYEVVGIKSNQMDGIALDSFRLTIDRKSLRERMEKIEYTITYTEKILNQQTSSSGSSVEDTDKESSSLQEEINFLHRSIKPKVVFGRDKEREHICSMLRNGTSSSSSKPYRVIGIHGITGSGKTTLAQYVCDYEKAKGQHFDPVMFIHVSESFRLDKIFRDMLREIKKDKESDENGVTALRDELKEELKGKCFLLVLDDLWIKDDENKREKEILLDTLNVGQRGSQILVTAQRGDAAEVLGAQEQRPIPDLEEEQYFSMFMHYALEGTSLIDDPRYIIIGRKIVEKLGRSPIAAVTVAARLRGNKTTMFWQRTANNDMLNRTMGALWWSYQHLCFDTRRCFAYCSTFPRGYKLKRDELVRIWMAQGYVKTSSNAKKEADCEGQHCFDELLTFSFFMQVQRSISENDKEFTIHDLLHELAQRVAGSDFHRIDLDSSPNDVPKGVRHVFIDTNNGAETAQNYLELENLRTLIIKDHCTDVLEKQNEEPLDVMKRNLNLEKVYEHLFTKLRKLRVLIFEIDIQVTVSASIDDQKRRRPFSIPATIERMKHLRYLCFRGIDHRMDLVLPSTISKLYHMQTIEVLPHFYTRKVSCPEDMSNLINLRHISGSLFFPNVGRLTLLETLTRFEVKKEQGHELKQLKNLNKLRGNLEIFFLEIVGSKEEALEAQLDRKKLLTELTLSFHYCRTRDADIVSEVVFEGLCPPKDLEALIIWKYDCSSRYPSWMLSRQHTDAGAPMCLQKLVLHQCSRLASIPEDSEIFKHLRDFRIWYCNWDSLPENMQRLEWLQTLIILYCDKMEILPPLPESLQKIEIIGCGVLSTTCEEEGHDNWNKIQHIPEKDIW